MTTLTTNSIVHELWNVHVNVTDVVSPEFCLGNGELLCEGIQCKKWGCITWLLNIQGRLLMKQKLYKWGLDDDDRKDYVIGQSRLLAWNLIIYHIWML